MWRSPVWRWLDLNILPVRHETLVLPYSAKAVYRRLWKSVKPVRKQDPMPEVPDGEFRFNGRIAPMDFIISRRVPFPENFLPLIKGRIESTPLGCIIFLRYRMFFSTNFFLAFWSLITFLSGLFLLLYKQYYWQSAAAFGIGVFNYILVIHSFNRQVRKSRQLLNEIFEQLES